MATYDKTFFIKVKDKWRSPIKDYVSKVKRNNPNFVKQFGGNLLTNLEKGNYLIIGCKYITYSTKSILELERVTIYYYDPTSYDMGPLKEINSTTK